ncbi:M48 family metallopeptidase [Alkalimonas mucilaginosa]|uniref:M48 family metallopeptidase n=1 Tax=Alkalimonas mucilaginosa TaxID=3057676 RepID=A0ABU7JBK8_9GAMM|nr:M48 family metallopeptidase [Alkalimonas sp. MEB004]MEE2023086.1 M48 family metallopeptidase [Alkalimonas sp. MEB004]
MRGDQAVAGHFQKPGQSTLFPATAVLADDGSLKVFQQNTEHLLYECAAEDYHFASIIPGLPMELELTDGGIFRPDDASFRWPQQAAHFRLAAWLESNRLSILSAVILAPLALWLLVTVAMPAMASAMVPFVPDQVRQQMGQQTFYALQKTILQPSTLSEEQQEELQALWQEALHSLELTYDGYQLHFYQSTFLGANAFALPDGTVVMTDALVELLKNKPDALLAILLHEIGHVEEQHSMRLVAQSLGAALVFGVFFGDAEALSELILGAGSGMLQNAFSRDMEREADQFAYTSLVAMGRSPEAFAEAMAVFAEQHGDSGQSEQLLKYLSTHPATAERIEEARKAAQLYQQTQPVE